MDDIRDIRKSDPISIFLDKQRIKTSPFGANQSAERLYRRAERTVAAIFLITNHLSEDEDLRKEARAQALKILNEMVFLRDEMRSPNSNRATSIRRSIRYLLSIVRMLPIAGFLSIQNATAVCEALDEVGNFLLTAQNTSLSENITLMSENLYDTHEMYIKDIKDTQKRRTSDVKDIKNTHNLSNSTNAATDDGLDVRKQNIIAILQSTESLGIKDIAANLPEYSEKMIQRELVDMVASGKVKKTGLKRWSRYSLVR
jgi:hypothetical protein